MKNEVKEYYNENFIGEWDRLINPYSAIEFKSNMYLIDKYFPKSGKVCDIGAGPGRYSIELLKKGYNVTLFELSDNELRLAEEKIKDLGLKADALICENALNLHLLKSESYDAILLMGPMYHLLKAEDRGRVLKESYRILKKDGVAIIAYINSWGVLKAGVTEFSEEFNDIQDVYNYLGTQSFTPGTSFTNLYMSTPSSALEEVKAAGFKVISYAGVEGFLAGIELRINQLAKENKNIYDNFVKVAAETCELPQYRDSTEHLHIVVRK